MDGDRLRVAVGTQPPDCLRVASLIARGQDQQDFLELWQKDHLTAIAPTYPVYQWRTAVIAATWILSGKPVPKEWVLPQPIITSDTLSQYVTPNMPPQFFSTCGCQHMPGFPKDWGGK